MSKFKAGTLKSGSGRKVTDREQARAIAASYAEGGLISGGVLRKVLAKHTNLSDFSEMRAKGMAGSGSKLPKTSCGDVVSYKTSVDKRFKSSKADKE